MITDAEARLYIAALHKYLDDHFGDLNGGPIPDDALSMAADLVEWVADKC